MEPITFNPSLAVTDVDTRLPTANPVEKRLVQKAWSVVAFPTRYVGSKSMSLPAHLVRGGRVMRNAVSSSLPPGSFEPVDIERIKYHYKLRMFSQEQTNIHMRYMAAAHFANVPTHVYDRSQQSWVNLPMDQNTFACNDCRGVDPQYFFNYEAMDITSLIVGDSSIGNIQADYIDDPKGFMDIETGLHFKVLHDRVTDCIVVAFGAGGSPISLNVEHSVLQNNFSDLQFQASKSQLKGFEPRVYEQAANCLSRIKDAYPDSLIVATGHCFGASLATYAALKNDIEAKCFNPLPLGAGLQNRLGRDTLASADGLITNISIEGDYTSDTLPFLKFLDQTASLIGIRTPGVFGMRYKIDSPREEYTSIDRHRKIGHGMMVYAGWRQLL